MLLDSYGKNFNDMKRLKLYFKIAGYTVFITAIFIFATYSICAFVLANL